MRIFDKFPDRTAKRLANALNKSAHDVAEDARLLVPVGDYRGAGDLRATIDVTPIEEFKNGKGVRVSVVAGTTRETADAAKRQEYGRKPGPNGHPGHPAQWFMGAGFWRNRRKARARIQRQIAKAAKEMKNA